MPSRPPSPLGRASSMRCTSRTVPSAVIDRILALSRSVTRAEPSGRNASPHGATRPLASVFTALSGSVTAGAPEMLGRANQPRQYAMPSAAASTTTTVATTMTTRRAVRRVEASAGTRDVAECHARHDLPRPGAFVEEQRPDLVGRLIVAHLPSAGVRVLVAPGLVHLFV